MPDDPTELTEAVLDDVSLSLLPRGWRHVRLECLRPDGSPDEHRADLLDAEQLVNAISDRIADLSVRAAAGGDVTVLMLDRNGRLLGSITARASFLASRVGWTGERHAENLVRAVGSYIAVDQNRLLALVDRAVGLSAMPPPNALNDPAYRRITDS